MELVDSYSYIMKTLYRLHFFLLRLTILNKHDAANKRKLYVFKAISFTLIPLCLVFDVNLGRDLGK